MLEKAGGEPEQSSTRPSHAEGRSNQRDQEEYTDGWDGTQVSIRVMNAAWSTQCSPGEKLVLLALADWANDDGVCWPSIKKLSEKSSAGERSVQRAIKSLIAAGHLSREDRAGKGVLFTVHPRQYDTPVNLAPVTPVSRRGVNLAPNTSRHTTPLEAKASKGNARPSDFDAFWEAYPRKVGKLAAMTAWKRLKPPLSETLAAIARYRQAKPADIDFCHPATWLNQGRWMDEHTDTTGPPVAVDPARYAAMNAEHTARQLAYLESLDAS